MVDYGAGNLRSVAKALEYLGAEPVVTNDPDAVATAQAIILPGQGACDSAMRALEGLGLVEPVRQAIRGGVPFFGVCLGLQLLFDVSEEGDVECLGIVPGRVRLLDDGLKVPHMGWSSVSVQSEHPVFEGVPQESYFYFVHSYYPDPDDAGAGRSDGVLRPDVLLRRRPGHDGGDAVPPGEERAVGPAAVRELPPLRPAAGLRRPWKSYPPST